MSAQATRDLLSTTDHLFNRSDDLFEETKRLARVLSSRQAFAGSSELQRLAAGGLDSSSLAQLEALTQGADSGGSTAAAVPALRAVLAECSAAASSISALQQDRDAVVSARREAIAQREAGMATKREELKVELSAICE